MVKVALAQINATVGDLLGNARLIAESAREAHTAGARVMLAPELALTGYPPEDLLLRPAFMDACQSTLAALAADLADLEGMHVVVGHPMRLNGDEAIRSKSMAVACRFNAASVLTAGHVRASYCKRELPNYQVFDERRYFVSGRDAGHGPVVFEVGGLRFGVLICEDAWFDEPAAAAVQAGAQVLCAWSDAPSPFPPRALAEVRRRGWAQSVAQREAGVASVSAPVRGPGGRIVAAVSVSGPIERLTRQPGRQHAPAVVAAAHALTEALKRAE